MHVYEVVIQCPNTGKAIATGHELSDMEAFRFVGLLPETVACPFCPDSHTWTHKDAWIQGKNASRVRMPASWTEKPKGHAD